MSGVVNGWTFDDEKPVSAQRGSVAVLANDDEVFVERDCGRVVTIPRAVIVELLRRTSAGISARLRAAEAEVERLRGALRNVRDNYDCDESAHKYGTTCRCCDARAALGEP